MQEAAEWANIVSAVAAVATAIAAFWALTIWWKQIAGASHHELAKKVSAAVRQVAIARTQTLKDLRWYRNVHADPSETPVIRALAQNAVERGAESLRLATDELHTLEGQIAVQWSEAMVELIDVIRYQSWAFALAAHVELMPEVKDTPAAQMIAKPDTIAPTFTGGTFEKAVDLYSELAQKWLGAHVGREGAREMSTEELAVRRKRIDDEIARLAEAERQSQSADHGEKQ